MFKKTKSIIFALLVISIFAINANKIKVETVNTNDKKEITEIYTFPENHIKLINTIFQEVPIYTLRLQSSYKKALTIISQENDIKETDIENLKATVLNPVKQLFTALHRKAFRFIIEPFIVSLLDKESETIIIEKTSVEKINIKNQKIKLEDVFKHMEIDKIPVGLKFLNSDEKECPDFFYNYVQNKETLLKACKELIALFEPINKILTEETKKKAVDYYKSIMAKKSKK